MAQGAARRRCGHAHRRPGRRLHARGRRASSHRGGRQQGVGDRRARDVPVAVRLARAAGGRGLSAGISARDGAGSPAARPAAGRGRPEGGRRRGRPRVHRQGQRPGPVRRRRARPRPGPRGGGADARRDGPVARPGDRLRAGARDRDPDHEGVPVLDRRQHLGPVVRDRRPRGPVGHATTGRVRMDRGAGQRPRSGGAGDRLRGRHPGLDRRRAARLGRAGPAAPRARWPPWRGAHRPCRGPAGGDQEPRDLRGAGRGHPPHRASRPRGPRALEGAAAIQPAGGRRAVADHLRRPVVQRPVTRSADLRHVLPARGLGGRAPAPRSWAGGRGRPALPALAVRPEPGDLRRGRRVRSRQRGRVHRDLRAAAPGRGGAPRRGGRASWRRVGVDAAAACRSPDDGHRGEGPRRPARWASPLAPAPGVESRPGTLGR